MTRIVARTLLVGIAILNLALAIAAAASWPSSYRHHQLAAFAMPQRTMLAVATREGTFGVGSGPTPGNGTRWLLYESFPLALSPLTLDAADSRTWRDGFKLSFSGPDYYVQAPTPVAILALLGVAAIAWHLARRLRPRVDPNRCRACGYDLRASPERCPECGTLVAITAEKQR